MDLRKAVVGVAVSEIVELLGQVGTMLIGEAGVAAISFEGEVLLGVGIQGGLEGCDSGVEGGAGQGRPSRTDLDEAGLANFGDPLVESDAVCGDPRDHGFNGGSAFVRIVVGGGNSEPLPQELGLTSDGGIHAGDLGLEEGGIEGRQGVAPVRVSGDGHRGFVAW